MISSFGSSPMPNQRIMIGTREIGAIPFRNSKIGPATASAERTPPRTSPVTTPATTPMLQPQPTRQRLIRMDSHSSPDSDGAAASLQTDIGWGRRVSLIRVPLARLHKTNPVRTDSVATRIGR